MAQETAQNALIANLMTSGLRTGSIRAATEAATGRLPPAPRQQDEDDDGFGAEEGREEARAPAPPIVAIATAVRFDAYRKIASLMQRRTGKPMQTEFVKAALDGSTTGRLLMAEYLDANMTTAARPRARGVTAELLTAINDAERRHALETRLISFITMAQRPSVVMLRRR